LCFATSSGVCERPHHADAMSRPERLQSTDGASSSEWPPNSSSALNPPTDHSNFLLSNLQHEDSRSSAGSLGSPVRVQPRCTPRRRCGWERLRLRDRWNVQEFLIEEAIKKRNRDVTCAIDIEEFRGLACLFNDGKAADPLEFGMVMQIIQVDCSNRMSITDVFYALHTWHRFQNLDAVFLAHFSEFDVDKNGKCNLHSLGELLTTLNCGVSVPSHEAQAVLSSANPYNRGPIERTKLLAAVVAWYVRVERGYTDAVAICSEAAGRVVKENDMAGRLQHGLDLVDEFIAAVRSEFTGAAGYFEVGANENQRGGWRPQRHEDGVFELGASSEPTGQSYPELSRMLSAAAVQFLIVLAPFLFGLTLIIHGISELDEDCPRDLRGPFLWIGMLAIVFRGLSCFQSGDWAGEARLAAAIMIILVNLLALSWAFDHRVVAAQSSCGEDLVTWNRFLWLGMPVALLTYFAVRGNTHVEHLKRLDRRLQREVLQ